MFSVGGIPTNICKLLDICQKSSIKLNICDLGFSVNPYVNPSKIYLASIYVKMYLVVFLVLPYLVKFSNANPATAELQYHLFYSIYQLILLLSLTYLYNFHLTRQHMHCHMLLLFRPHILSTESTSF